MAEKPLTPMMTRFVEEYLIDPKGDPAYERAGYKARGAAAAVCASKLLKKANIRAAIERGQEKRAERVEITQDAVLRGLYEEATRMGEGASHSARVSAWAHLGKHLGMFIDRKVIGLKRFEDMSDEEIQYLLGELTDEIESIQQTNDPGLEPANALDLANERAWH